MLGVCGTSVSHKTMFHLLRPAVSLSHGLICDALYFFPLDGQRRVDYAPRCPIRVAIAGRGQLDSFFV